MPSNSSSRRRDHKEDKRSGQESEKLSWKVFVRVCDLTRSDCQVLWGKQMEYSTMKRLSMLGLDPNIQLLLKAGLSHAKANMIILFATYILHNHSDTNDIPFDLTFDDVLAFGLKLKRQNQHLQWMPQQPQWIPLPAQPPMLHPHQLTQPQAPQIPNVEMDRSSPSMSHSGSAKKCLKSSHSSRGTSNRTQTTAASSMASRWSANEKPNMESPTATMVREVPKVEEPRRWSGADVTFHSGTKSAGTNRVKRSHRSSPAGPPIPRQSTRSEPARRQIRDSSPIPPSRSPAAGATLKWALALDLDDEDLTDSGDELASGDLSDDGDDDSESGDESDSDSEEDSDESDSDNDDEADLAALVKDAQRRVNNHSHPATKNLNQHQSGAVPKAPKQHAKDSTDVFTFKMHNVNTHEWTLPANQILPVSLQDLIKEAYRNPEMDIQQRIQAALMGR
jgi:hypothetical protein